MPQIIITHSNSISLRLATVVEQIEATIKSHDSSVGKCRGRSFIAQQYTDSYISVDISLLKKPHRTPEFVQKLIGNLYTTVKKHIDKPCVVYLSVDFFSENMIISEHIPSS